MTSKYYHCLFKIIWLVPVKSNIYIFLQFRFLIVVKAAEPVYKTSGRQTSLTKRNPIIYTTLSIIQELFSHSHYIVEVMRLRLLRYDYICVIFDCSLSVTTHPSHVDGCDNLQIP